jgi:DNA-binding response OmpR family regulator
VIFLTSYEQGTAEELKALQVRANYYINKVRDPGGMFLLAALENVLAARDAEEASGYRRGSLNVDRDSQPVRWKGQEVDLTSTEFLIVDFVAFRCGTPQSYERIRRAAQIQAPRNEDLDYRTADELETARAKRLRGALHTHVSSIREKFEKLEATVQAGRGSPELARDFQFRSVLATEHDLGYRWKKDQ